MKPIILLLFTCLLVGRSVMAQPKRDTLQNALNKAYYLKLSRTQKTQATVLAIGGGAAILVGGYIWFISPVAGITGSSEGVKSAKRTGVSVMAVGASLTAISIPLFNASKQNQKKAELYIGSGPLLHPLYASKEMLCLGTRITLP